VKSTPGSLQEALDALESDYTVLLRGDVFTKDAIKTWLSYKPVKEVDAIALRAMMHSGRAASLERLQLGTT
jgi:glutamine synthetase